MPQGVSFFKNMPIHNIESIALIESVLFEDDGPNGCAHICRLDGVDDSVAIRGVMPLHNNWFIVVQEIETTEGCQRRPLVGPTADGQVADALMRYYLSMSQF